MTQKEPTKIEDSFFKETENGPAAKRSCTDMICWVIWIAACAFWVFSVFYGIGKGDPKKVFAAWDEDGQQCGYSTVTKSYSYAYFYTVLDVSYISTVQTRVICVSGCPTYSTDPAVTALDTLATKSITCVDTTASASFSNTNVLASGTSGCTNFYAYKSFAFLGAFCLPSLDWINNTATTLSATSSQFSDVFSKLGTVTQWIDNLSEIWYLI